MYKSLDTIPFKIFIQIVDTGLIHLLSKEDKEPEEYSVEEILKFKIVWDKIYKTYLELAPNEDDRKLLNIEKEIEFFQTKYKLVLMCCDCLAFDWNDDIVQLLREYGYTLSVENYYDDIDVIARESEALLVKCDRFIKMLPEPKEEDKKPKAKVNTDDMFASFSAILGIDFDYNTISVTKTMALQKQVEAKIKSLESQTPKT